MKRIRYDQITVEITKFDGVSSHSRIVSCETFLSEHNRLYNDIRKRRSLMPSKIAAEERLNEKLVMNMLENPNALSSSMVNSIEFKPIPESSLEFSGLMHSPSKRLIRTTFEKKKAADHLKLIAKGIKEDSKYLENQILEIRSRGWNLDL